MLHKPIYKKLGMNYITYSALAAKYTRRALKKNFLKEAFSREISLINIFYMVNGKRGPNFIPYQLLTEEQLQQQNEILTREKEKLSAKRQ
ncbi:hypothetical protein GWI33_007835 [Rhynchophorus ferrugineus]|uniref:Uncharacterized protein n=1 Tax=Rhynchophorus ferrugineus TaxID=354439 RepID=A0A834IH49_RHYFE|nr:hypothetical protein GWI33_007835 [Rhynchophorus ferrugineus]